MVALLGASVASQAQDLVILERAPFEAGIGERDVSFIAHDLETGTRHVLEGSDLDQRHAPWSTFKIPNFLIALEAGVIPDMDETFAWDTSRRPARNYWPQSWRQEQSLRTAFQRSAVWFFRDIALEIDTQSYRDTLADWEYGIADIAEGSDSFWLNQGLMISAREQITFLARMLQDELAFNGQPITQTTLDALDVASLARQIGEISLHGKTGAGTVIPGDFSGPFDGWYVGYVRRQSAQPIVFALYAQGPDFQSIRAFRQDFATRILVEAGLLPTAFGQE
jgi:beta-lactamase class D